MKRLVLALLLAVVGAAAAITAQDKVDICHRTNGTNEFVVISISVNALDKHLEHGDTQSGICGIIGDPQ